MQTLACGAARCQHVKGQRAELLAVRNLMGRASREAVHRRQPERRCARSPSAARAEGASARATVCAWGPAQRKVSRSPHVASTGG